MSHLSIETLARLVDEAPESHEAAHLEACLDCRSELEGMKADSAALAALPEIEPPGAHWLAIEQRLIAEGLLRRSARQWAVRSAWRPALQLAAALVIFVLGYYTAPLLRAGSSAPSSSAPGATLIANAPASADEAAVAVRETERAYLTALTRYAELAGQTSASDPLARLAALESIVTTTRQALGQAPADPVINGYHMTALAQRDATIKRLASASGQTWF